MPLGVKPECIQCKNTETSMWKNTELGFLCNECNQRNKDDDRQASTSGDDTETNGNKISLRKSTMMARNYFTRTNPTAGPKITVPKGRGRRSLMKKKPIKSAQDCATTRTRDFLWFKDKYYQIGDVLSFEDDGDIYYAQIKGLVIDAYGENSAVISWLIPSTSSPHPSQCFDPSTYMIGVEECIPRKLTYSKWVMHLPFDYYTCKDSPYPPVPQLSDMYKPGFIWSRVM